MSHIAVKARALFKKIEPLVPDDCEDSKLMYYVFKAAVQDLISRRTPESDRRYAAEYLKGEMPHLNLIGINPEYVRRVMKSLGIMEIVNEQSH